MNKKLKIEFAPGCFDSFDGTQEELDELIAEIHRGFETGEIFENSTIIDVDDIDSLVEEDPQLAAQLIRLLDSDSQETQKRNIH